MEYFAGLEVSLRSCALCVMDGTGTALLERELPFEVGYIVECLAGFPHPIVAHSGAHAAILMDTAGWHTTPKLVVPANISIIFLPPRPPELNPQENIWQYLRQNWLSNRVFETYDAIVEAGCLAWHKLTQQPETISSIGTRKWAHKGQ